jgi:glutamyl-tRNA reductase
MTIVNVGLSHRFAPAEMLEKLAVPSAELGDALTRLHAGVTEPRSHPQLAVSRP